MKLIIFHFILQNGQFPVRLEAGKFQNLNMIMNMNVMME